MVVPVTLGFLFPILLNELSCLKAFADLAILAALKDRALTDYGINNYFMKIHFPVR